MGIPLAGTGSVTEDTSVSGSGLLTSTGDVDYLFGSDAGQWTAQTITGLYGSALTIDTNGVWTYSATNANGTLQALNTGRYVDRSLHSRLGGWQYDNYDHDQRAR